MIGYNYYKKYNIIIISNIIYNYNKEFDIYLKTN